MNKRFKFRAWDKDIKRYFKHGNFDLQRACKDKSLIIEQCTGLKDRKGQLIYEGDIVKTKDDIGEVKWDKGGFWLVCDTWVVPWNFFTPSRWEIIGNIHENKELLKRKQK